MNAVKRRGIIKLSSYPELVKEFDFSLNEKGPDEISFCSNIKVHWVCHEGHKWQDTPGHRTKDKRGCPFCNGTKLWVGSNDLKTKYPNIVKEWDYNHNILGPEKYLPTNTKEKVWWICPRCGNSYQMTIRDRVHSKRGCPFCSHQKLSSVNDSLKAKYPDLVREWDYSKNTIKPDEIYPSSNKIVWWKCDKGHEWQASPNGRIIKGQTTGCPVCSGKRIVKGVNDLFTKRPDLEKYWDFEKNNVNPYKLALKSNQYVYWKCDKGHSFKARIYSVVIGKMENVCPVCSNRVVLAGVNDMATTNPELINEFNYDKNNFKPNEIHVYSNKIVWWKCDKGHEWQASINSRAIRHYGCPYCSNQKLLKGFNDFATLCPDVLEFWDDKKNKKKPDEIIGSWSAQPIYLKCKFGHSWKSTPGSFSRGSRCPVCGNKKVEKGFNDFETTHPEIAKQWHPTKNGDLSPSQFTYGSDYVAWWKCENGHSYQCSINRRAKGTGCSICAKEQQTSLPEKTVYFYLSKYFKDIQDNVHLEELGKRELDIYIPSLKLAIEYDGQRWHKNVEKDLVKDGLCKTHGIKLIRIREEGCPTYESDSIKIICHEIHNNIFLLKDALFELFHVINDLFNLNIASDIDIQRDYGSINKEFILYKKRQSLAVKHPEIAKEWNYEKNGDLNPEYFSYGSNKKVWWKCDKGHEWLASVGSRTGKGKNGCPFCSNKYLLKGFNDLETRYPEIAKEWNYEKNGNLTPDEIKYCSNKKVWWKCDKGHEWDAIISSRTRTGVGCRICAGLVPEKGVNDLETLFPEIAKEWDYEKNYPLKPSDLLPGSEVKVWWKCPKGHSYPAIPRTRTLMGTGCSVCANKLVQEGVNDLQTLHPELAKEWHPTKNGDLKPTQVGGGGGSHKKVWWLCPNGHEYEASLASRIKLHTGCKQCSILKRTKRSSREK